MAGQPRTLTVKPAAQAARHEAHLRKKPVRPWISSTASAAPQMDAGARCVRAGHDMPPHDTMATPAVTTAAPSQRRRETVSPSTSRPASTTPQ